MSELVQTLDKGQVAKNFDRAAGSYDNHDFLQREVAARLLDQLNFINLKPQLIADLGSGTGSHARALAKRYRKANVINLDLAPQMLAKARSKAPKFWSRQHFLCSDIEAIPITSESFDFVFANLSLQWVANLAVAFTEIRRVMKDGAVIMFSTLGPDTLAELKSAWAQVSSTPRVNTFFDMHDIGDALVSAGFTDPVLETDRITIEYAEVMDLLRDLKGIGAVNSAADRRRGVTTASRVRQMSEAYEAYRRGDRLPATYEVVYAHAWATPMRGGASEPGVFPLTRIERR